MLVSIPNLLWIGASPHLSGCIEASLHIFMDEDYKFMMEG